MTPYRYRRVSFQAIDLVRLPSHYVTESGYREVLHANTTAAGAADTGLVCRGRNCIRHHRDTGSLDTVDAAAGAIAAGAHPNGMTATAESLMSPLEGLFFVI